MEGQPNALFDVALAAYVPAVFAAFWVLGSRRGAIASLLGGWLFLPVLSMSIGPPLFHTKEMFVPAVVLAASLAFDLRQWLRFRPSLLDIPVAVLCCVPFATALANDLGVYEAGSAIFASTMTWGAPYLLARVYFARPAELEEFALALVIAGLVYVPFCLWEIRMSPNLHRMVYGYAPFSTWGMVMRYGGYRPNVFTQNGLAVGMFMTSASLVALWMWRTGARRALAGVPFGWVALVLLVTTVLCKSTGSTALLAAGLVALEVARRLRTPLLLFALLLAPVAFAGGRLGGWSGQELVAASERWVNPDRAQSVQFRIENEDKLIAKAMKRPWLGWGRFGRSRVYDEAGQDMVITDGMWIISLGMSGFLGLVSLWLVLALPTVALLRLFPARQWGDPRLAAVAALATGASLWAIDDLLNAMMNPLFPAISGALISYFLLVRNVRRLRRASQRAAARVLPRRVRWAQSAGS